MIVKPRFGKLYLEKAAFQNTMPFELLSCFSDWSPHAAEADHSEIIIHFENENANQKKGSGLWEFNNSLLKNQ